MNNLSPTLSISQPRYLPAINYLQRIYHSDVFIFLDDCQHQRRAFEHRNKILKPNEQLSLESQWLSLKIDKSSGSRPLIKDVNFVSLRENLQDHAKIIAQTYGQNSLAYEAFRETCELVVSSNDDAVSFVDFCRKQILAIYGYLGISLETELLFSSSLPGDSSGSSRLLECAVATSSKCYISGPNGRNYLTASDFEEKNIKIMYHDFLFPRYSQFSSDDFLPWMAWIDMLNSVGINATAKVILSSPTLSPV